jgi:hypothetical protein
MNWSPHWQLLILQPVAVITQSLGEQTVPESGAAVWQKQHQPQFSSCWNPGAEERTIVWSALAPGAMCMAQDRRNRRVLKNDILNCGLAGSL